MYQKGASRKAMFRPAAWQNWGIKTAVQWFTDNPGKRKGDPNTGLDLDKLDKWLNKNHSVALGRTSYIEETDTLTNDEWNDLFDFLEDKYGPENVKETTLVARTGRKTQAFEITPPTPEYSILETREREKAGKRYLNKAVKVLKKAFPDVEVVFGYEEYYQSVKEITREGVEVPYNAKGFVWRGKVYLNPLAVTKDTPFHEYAHLWVKGLLASPQGIKLFKQGVEVLKGSEYMRIVDSIPYYRAMRTRGDVVSFYEEVMANALGKRASYEFDSAEKANAWEKFMKDFTDWIKYKLNIGSKNEFYSLTLDDWLGIGAKSILTGDQTAYASLNEQQQIEATTPAVLAALPEGYDASITQKDYDNARYNVRKIFRGQKLTRGWEKLPEYANLIQEEATRARDRRSAKETATATKKPVEPLIPASENKTFKRVMDLFEKGKAENQRSLSKGYRKAFLEIPNEKLARAAGRSFQDFSERETGLVQFFSQVGSRAYPVKPKDMSKEEFRRTQYTVGLVMAEMLVENGILDVDFSYGAYEKAAEAAKAKKQAVNRDQAYIIDIKDVAAVNELADAVAIYPNAKPDFKEVYRGKNKPMKQDGFRGKDGLQLVSRDLDKNRMTRKTHPKVFEVKDAADQTRYVVDTGYLKYLKEFEKLGLLAEGVGVSKDSKERSMRVAIQNLESIGEESFASAHNFVHNGRLMNTSTDVSHQSSKNILAAYSFEQKDPLGKGGWKWLKVLTQDSYAYSGIGDTKNSRQAAAELNQETWMKWAADPMKYKNEIMGADVPMLFLRHILEMKAAIDSGNPETFESGLPAHMDATTSGLQFLAAMTKDPEAAKITNLTDTDVRGDSYSEVVKEVIQTLQKESPLPENAKEIYSEFLKRHNSFATRRQEIGNIEDKVERQEAWNKYKEDKKKFDKWKDANKAVAAQYFWNQPPQTHLSLIHI